MIELSSREPNRLPFAFGAAIVLHTALAFVMGTQRPAAAAPPPPIEMEIAEAPKELKQEATHEEVKKVESEPAPPTEHKVASPIHHASPAPAAAKAAPIVTAKDDAPTDKEPVSFVTDPNGSTFGSGVVAKGGTADVGVVGAKSAGAIGGTGKAPIAAAPPPIDALVAAADLSRPPRLDDPDACKGRFPSAADDDTGVATLVVTVLASGEVKNANVANETPKGQGFGAAARSCLLAKRFVPALDKNGKPAATQTKVTVRFTR